MSERPFQPTPTFYCLQGDDGVWEGEKVFRAQHVSLSDSLRRTHKGCRDFLKYEAAHQWCEQCTGMH